MLVRADGEAVSEAATPEEIAFEPGRTMGEGLRLARESLGIPIEDIADDTRVRRVHLLAIEQMDLERLPSRPFAIGYVRSYAEALGLDASRAAARFRADTAEDDDDVLRAPLGTDDATDPRRIWLIVSGIVVLVAIVGWNFAQRTFFSSAVTASSQIAEGEDIEAPELTGPVVLAKPAPPPIEATLPPRYVTPGLENFDSEVAAEIQAEADAARAELQQEAVPFVARGSIYGAPADQPYVMLQAVREVTLIIRPPSGQIRDIRTLEEGESYRAPIETGLLVDVSMPSSVEYYVDGMLAGSMEQSVVPVTQLARDR